MLSHDVGDQVLVLVLGATLLETKLTAVAPDGFVAWTGGEEFLLALPGAPGPLANRMLDGIRRTIGAYDQAEITADLPITVSIGAAGLADAPAPTQSGFLSIADRNPYVAKHAGRDRVISGAHTRARSRSYRDGVSTA